MRPTHARISLPALRANAALAQRLAPSSKLAAVVKANAYGHGAVRCAQALSEQADIFAVACIDEALELRAAGVSQAILLLEGHFSVDELALSEQQNFWLMLHSDQQIQQLLAYSAKKPLTAWLKVDTGMHRLGLDPAAASNAYQMLSNCKHVQQPVVVASHFASADSENTDSTNRQIHQLTSFNEDKKAPLSLSNSAGVLAHGSAHGDWIRPGIMLYGSSPLEYAQASASQLRAVMSLHSEVIAIRNIAQGECVGYAGSWCASRPSRIATVAVGYGDGYPRNAPSGTPVLLNGQLMPLCGRVSMDMITVDVTDHSDAQLGSPVELWGDTLDVNKVAEQAGTIGYELLTRMPGRVPLQYVED
ncbi:MAG: alanine racemase [Pseudomonadales bacterium]